MYCDICHKNEANVFFKQSVNGRSSQYHLCQACLAKIKQSQGLNFGEDLLRTDMAQGLETMPFASLSRLGQMMHSFDDQIFSDLLSLLSPKRSSSFDLSPFLFSSRSKNLDQRSEQADSAQAEHRKLENLSDGVHLEEAKRLAQEKMIMDRLARLSIDEDGKLRLELESKDERKAGSTTPENQYQDTDRLLTETEIKQYLAEHSLDENLTFLAEQKKKAIDVEAYEQAAQIRDLSEALRSKQN